MITIGGIGNSREGRDIVTDILPSTSTVAVRNYAGILTGLKEIKDKYDASVREKAAEYGASSVESKDFDTDEAIYARAKRESDSSYDVKVNKATAKRNNAVKDAETSAATLRESYFDTLHNIGVSGKKSEAAHAEKMAKQGMSHSSVNELESERLRDESLRSARALNTSYAAKMNALDEKIARAESAYSDALRSYEISYAIDLENRLAKYKTQRDKLLAEYNASADKQRADSEKAYLEENEALNAAYEKANGDYAGDKKKNYQERYDYVKSAADKMTAAEKKSFLSEYGGALQEYLGLYYDKLLKEI